MLSTGFLNWSPLEYKQFIKGIKKFQFNEYEEIANQIGSKTPQEVNDYMNVFLQRFRELKEGEQVISRLLDTNLDEQIAETVKNYDPSKDYVMLLQENLYYNKVLYLGMMEQSHNKMQGSLGKLKDPQLKLDHFFYSQTQKMVADQLKYIALAIKSEETLKSHIFQQDARKQMRKLIIQSKQFKKQSGLMENGEADGIQGKERMLVQRREKEEIKQETHQIKRVGAVDDSVKYGRGKKTAKLFKNSQHQN